jgi:hypothetical protein
MHLARAAIFSALISQLALAQAPGLGETRPLPPGSGEDPPPALGDSKEPRPPQPAPQPHVDSDRAVNRCQELAGALREDCLREERSAAGGATREAEPPTAPPPQNPR